MMMRYWAAENARRTRRRLRPPFYVAARTLQPTIDDGDAATATDVRSIVEIPPAGVAPTPWTRRAKTCSRSA
jgi:phage portal protein BeeE